MDTDNAREATDTYSVVLYRRGPEWERDKPLGEQHAVHDHVAYLQRLITRGYVSRAGPFHAPTDLVGEDPVGIAIFETGTGEAAEIARQDPAVQAHLMGYEVLPWYP